STTHCEHVECCGDRGAERAKFIIHLDAKCLEHTLRRVTLLLHSGRCCLLKDVHELTRTGDRRILSCSHDCSCISRGKWLITVHLEKLSESSLGFFCEKFGGSAPCGLVHAHIQWRVLCIRKSSIGIIELER